MRVSRSEFEATVRKAARGAEWSPALAEDLSRAAGALAAIGGSGGELALGVIEAAAQTKLAACFTAFELSLTGDAAEVTGASDDLLRACALSLGAEHDVSFAITHEGETARISVAPMTPVEIVEIDVATEIWTSLQRLAHKSYVPASAASRLAGAGAGLTDND